jgi:hypothetical protein
MELTTCVGEAVNRAFTCDLSEAKIKSKKYNTKRDQHSSSVVIKHPSMVTWNQHKKFLLEEMLVVFGK